MRHAIFVPNFGVFSDPVLVSDLARRAESAGFDGWFLWDHVVHRDGDEPAADPWITLAAVATSTSRIRLGPMVTPLPRRRPWNVARQAATLDHLSGGEIALKFYHLVDRRELLQKAKAVQLVKPPKPKAKH